MPSHKSLVVAAVIVFVLVLGIATRQLVEQQRAINNLRGQIMSLRGPIVRGATPLTISGIESVAIQAENDAQDALRKIDTSPNQPTIDPNAQAIATLQSQVSCIENNLQELADYQQQGQNTTLWFSTCL